MNSGLIRLIWVGELPRQLRCNREPLGKRAKALEELGPFLWRDRESDAQPSCIGDQIGSDQKDQSRTARSRRSNQHDGSTVSRNPINRL